MLVYSCYIGCDCSIGRYIEKWGTVWRVFIWVIVTGILQHVVKNVIRLLLNIVTRFLNGTQEIYYN